MVNRKGRNSVCFLRQIIQAVCRGLSDRSLHPFGWKINEKSDIQNAVGKIFPPAYATGKEA